MTATVTTQAALMQLETTILTDVVTQVANLNQSTLRRLLLVKFEGQPVSQAIGNLINQSFLVRHGTPSGEEAYLPTAAAFNFCGDTELRNRAKSATTVVFHALKQMFKGEQKKEGLVLDDLKRHVEYIYPNRIFDTSTLKLGLYLAKDFNIVGDTDSIRPMTPR